MALAKIKKGKNEDGQQEVGEEHSAVNDAIRNIDILSNKQSDYDWTKDGMLEGNNRKLTVSDPLVPEKVKRRNKLGMSKSPAMRRGNFTTNIVNFQVNCGAKAGPIKNPKNFTSMASEVSSQYGLVE